LEESSGVKRVWTIGLGGKEALRKAEANETRTTQKKYKDARKKGVYQKKPRKKPSGREVLTYGWNSGGKRNKQGKMKGGT